MVVRGCEGQCKWPRVSARADVLAMATADVESRPKGGWAEYRDGPQALVHLHGKSPGEMMGGAKEFGTGAYADAPYRFRSIEEHVKSIRWFYGVVIEKMDGGALNPASTSTFKRLMTALSVVMGVRRVYMPQVQIVELSWKG